MADRDGDPACGYPLSAEMAAFVARTRAHASTDGSIEAQRAAYRRMCKAFDRPRPAGLSVHEGKHADRAYRLYQPAGPAPTAGWPWLLYLHGGGWIMGDLGSHDLVCSHFASRLGIVVAALDYRLAPEHPFPAAVEDSVALWTHLADGGSAGALLDPTRGAVAGDSAGGALAVSLCLALRAAGRPLPVAQMLFYPALSPVELPSHRRHPQAPLLTRDDMAFCLDAYLPNAATRSNPLALPLAADDFIGLPPAFIGVAEWDPLRDDGECYARRLTRDGVPVRFDEGLGLVHGCLRGLGTVPEVDGFYERCLGWWGESVNPP